MDSCCIHLFLDISHSGKLLDPLCKCIFYFHRHPEKESNSLIIYWLFSFFKKYLYVSMYEFHICVRVCAWTAEDGIGSSEAGVTVDLAPMCVLGTNLSLLEQQQALWPLGHLSIPLIIPLLKRENNRKAWSVTQDLQETFLVIGEQKSPSWMGTVWCLSCSRCKHNSV